MDAGADDADRRTVPDATVLELHVDDEPAFVQAARLPRLASVARQIRLRHRRLVTWGWFTTLLMLVACALWSTIGFATLDSSQRGVKIGDIERTVGSDLSGQLLGDLRVHSVRCVRQTQTDARCVAEVFDKSGDGPISQGVAVSIEQHTGEYSWQAGPAD
jgi:hypothetical protein